MCHASVQAFKDLWELGTITSGAAMVSSSSLLDADGYFHQWHQAVYDNAKPEAVETEVNAQIERPGSGH